MVSSVRHSSRQQGMTLLELLVVMTLLALVGSLLMQGFGTALSTYERVQRRQNEGVLLELSYRWFSDTVAGTQAELDPPRQFRGDSQMLTGITHRPLLGTPGQVSFFTWQLQAAEDGRLQLIYSQPDQIKWLVATWPAGTQGKFIFRSLKGAGTDHWPDGDERMSAPVDGRIPGAILLQIDPPGMPTLRWYVNLPGRPFPRPDYRDL